MTCVFSIAQHGKGDVDHVWVHGVAKTTIRREIESGELFENKTCMIDFLEQQYKSKTNPTFLLKETDNKDLLLLTVKGSNMFQVMVFYLFYKIINGSSRLCLCMQ